MEARGVSKNEEYHELLYDLEEKRFFGEVTLYMQDGNIESSRTSERKSKKEVKTAMEALRTHRSRGVPSLLLGNGREKSIGKG